MKLSPLDIRKHTFSKSFRGFDPEEVQSFLDMISGQWEEIQDAQRRAEDRVREMESKIQHYEQIEMALREAIESARDTAQRTQANAEERARIIVEEAELRAQQLLQDAEQERFKLRRELARLNARHGEVTSRLRHFLMSELEVLAQVQGGEAGLPRLLQQPPEDDARNPFEPDLTDAEVLDETPSPKQAPPSGGPKPPASAPPDPAAPPPAPSWTLHSLVTGPEPTRSATPPDEQERIRRILEDLD